MSFSHGNIYSVNRIAQRQNWLWIAYYEVHSTIIGWILDKQRYLFIQMVAKLNSENQEDLLWHCHTIALVSNGPNVNLSYIANFHQEQIPTRIFW